METSVSKYYINRIETMAKSHTYHMFLLDDRPTLFLDLVLADPILSIPEKEKK